MADDFYMNKPVVMSGLGVFTCVVPANGYYHVEAKSTISPDSDLQIVIKRNTTVIATSGGVSTNPSASQLSLGASVDHLLDAGDLLKVVLSSSLAVDNAANSIKTTINAFTKGTR